MRRKSDWGVAVDAADPSAHDGETTVEAIPRVNTILRYIRSIEDYMARLDATLVRTPLPEWVHGRTHLNGIALRAGLAPEQELLALVHELAHWLTHQRRERHRLDSTIFEYEAEAVERLVMARLGLPHPEVLANHCGDDHPTDNLLAASVTRVQWASDQICSALSEPQTAVDLETAPGKKVVLEYELHRMSDFIGSTQAL